MDVGLVALFTTQHSLLAWSPVKQALQSVLGALNRTAYCFTTALALQVQKRTLALNAFHILEFGIFDTGCFLHSDLDAVLAACDRRPLSVVSTSCTLEYLVPSALLLPALPLLGDHLQHPHDF